MGAAYVQDTTHQTGNNVANDTGSFPTLPAVGNSVFALTACWNGTPTAGNIVDNQSGNTYTLDVSEASGTGGGTSSAGLYACPEIVGSSGTFTLTFDPSQNWFEWIGIEFSGLANSGALDITKRKVGTDASPTTVGGTGGGNIAQADSLLIAAVTVTDSSGADIGLDLPSGWTLISTIANPAATIACLFAYRITTAIEALDFNGGSLSRTPASGWSCIVAAYKAAAANAITPGAGSLSFVGNAPTVSAPRSITPPVGSLVLTGYAGSLVAYDPAIAGPKLATVAATDAVDGGTAWSGPDFIKIADSTYAQVVTVSSNLTQYLTAQGFNFNIDPTRSIVGFKVEAVNSKSNSGSAIAIVARLMKNDVIRVSFRSQQFTTSDGVSVIYGGELDSWDEPWTPAEVSSPTFGVALRKEVTTSSNLTVDAIQITVFTTDAVLPVATYSGFATFGPTSIPVDKTSITFYLDAVFHTNASVTATLSVDVSYDGGSNWELFIKASGAGGTVAGPSGITEPRWYMRRFFPNPTDSNVRFRGALVVTGGSLLTSVGVFTN